jgi:hypothetical protein
MGRLALIRVTLVIIIIILTSYEVGVVFKSYVIKATNMTHW